MSESNLKNLLVRVQRLIDTQGEDAPCAAFIFTKEDVFDIEDGTGQISYKYSTDECHEILGNVEQEYDSIYEKIFDCISDEMINLSNRKNKSNA